MVAAAECHPAYRTAGIAEPVAFDFLCQTLNCMVGGDGRIETAGADFLKIRKAAVPVGR